MSKLKFPLLLVLLPMLSLSNVNYAQDSGGAGFEPTIKSRFLTLGAGAANQTNRDEGLSPLRYQGLLVSSQLGYEVSTLEKIERWDLLFNYGITKPDPYTNQNQVWEGYFNYVHLREFRPLGSYGNWYVGGAANVVGNFRYNSQIVNTDLFYDVFVSASIASAVDYQFKLKDRQFLVNYQLSLPLLSYGFRPTYSGLFNVAPPDEDYVGEVLEHSGFGSWETFFSVKSMAELVYPLKSGNQLKLQYNWNFYTAKLDYHRVTNADQILLFILCFRL